jgi:prevent-host-death family protein
MEDQFMATVTNQEAQAKLAELIHRLMPGDEVVITENDRPIARLAPAGRIPTATTATGNDEGNGAVHVP